jgi:tetratricopeptide (TPR) repeat protein
MSDDPAEIANQANPPNPRRYFFYWLTGLLIGGLALGMVVVPGYFSSQPNLPPSVTVRDYQNAREAFELQYGRHADRLDVLSFLAELYLSRGRLANAVECFNEIPTSHPRYGPMARLQQGRTLLTLHRAIEAEQQFRDLITHEEATPTLEPKFLLDARQRLRHILEVELRFEERQPILLGMVERDEADHFETVVALFPSHLRWNGNEAVNWLEQFHAANPDDRRLNIALGRYRTGQGKLDEARRLLEAVIRDFPTDRFAVAALVACLRESGETDAADHLIEALPPMESTDPWLLVLQRGSLDLQQGRAESAARAYQQLLSQDRTNTEAWQKIAQVHRMQGNELLRKRAVEVAAGLSRIQNHIGKGIQRPEDSNSFLDIADVCIEIEFDKEAWILARFAKKLAPRDARVAEMFTLLQSRKPTESLPNAGGN